MLKPTYSFCCLALLVCSSVYADDQNDNFKEEMAKKEAALKVVKQEAIASSLHSKTEFMNILNSNNLLKELPEENRDKKHSNQVWLQRTKNTARNSDAISKEWGGRANKNKFEHNAPLKDLPNTDFYRNTQANAGGVALYNNHLLPITDGKEVGRGHGADVGILFSGQETPYSKPSPKCDALGDATTGQTGLLFVRASNAVNVLKQGVTSKLIMRVTDLTGKEIASYSSKSKASSYDSVSSSFFEKQQYFMINQANHTFNLAAARKHVRVCIEVVNTQALAESIRGNNYSFTASELAKVRKDQKRWQDRQNDAGNTRWMYGYGKPENNVDIWVTQYKLWVRARMNKYVDFMWLGL